MWTRSAHENSYCSSSTLYMYKHIFFLKTLNLWEGNFNFFIFLFGGGGDGWTCVSNNFLVWLYMFINIFYRSPVGYSTWHPGINWWTIYLISRSTSGNLVQSSWWARHFFPKYWYRTISIIFSVYFNIFPSNFFNSLSVYLFNFQGEIQTTLQRALWACL